MNQIPQVYLSNLTFSVVNCITKRSFLFFLSFFPALCTSHLHVFGGKKIFFLENIGILNSPEREKEKLFMCKLKRIIDFKQKRKKKKHLRLKVKNGNIVSSPVMPLGSLSFYTFKGFSIQVSLNVAAPDVCVFWKGNKTSSFQQDQPNKQKGWLGKRWVKGQSEELFRYVFN